MTSTFKYGFYAGLLGAFVIGLWLARLWQPENQVRLHSEHLVRQIEQRDWSAAGDFFAADYHDDWGDDRALLLSRLRMVLRAFSSLTITAAHPETRLEPAEGSWSAHIQMAGNGTEVAPEILSRVNSLTTPFALHWRRESWRPWDWKLLRVSNPSLEISGDLF
jgi:hypothetical protein